MLFFALELDATNVPKSVRTLLKSYEDVFPQEVPAELTLHKRHTTFHWLDFQNLHYLIEQPIRMNSMEKEELNRQLQELLDKDKHYP